MQPIARTNVQLYNQLRSAGRRPEELALIRRAYDFAVTLYSGCFQADGSPFVCHIIGVASIVAQLDPPAEVVAAACLHNVYGNGDFGDGRHNAVTPYRRQMVRDAAGPEVETYVHRFREMRSTQRTARAIPHLDNLDALDALDARDRYVVVIELADILEKYTDGGLLYYGDHAWVTGFVAEQRDTLTQLARRLGYPQLAAALDRAFESITTEPAPEELRTKRKHLALVMPLSCRLRSRIAVRQLLLRAKGKTGRLLRATLRRSLPIRQ